MKTVIGLSVFAMLLNLPIRAQAETPVVIDATNSFQTAISADRTTKEGFPWGWIPQTSIIIKMDSIESDDVLVLQHFQGKKKWGSAQKCRLRTQWKSVGMANFQCKADEKMGINKGGKFSVKISYKQAALDKLHKNIDTMHYNVLKYKCDNRHVKRKWKPSSCYVVNHDFRMGEAWITEVAEDDTAPTLIQFRTWFKYSDKEPHRPKARCYLNDKKVAEAKIESKQKEITYRFYKKARGPGSRETWARWYWRFYDLGTQPPVKTLSTVSYPNVFYISKNPGDYKCVVTADGDKIATMTFKVGDDGKIVRPSCQGQTADNTVRTLDNVHLINVEYGKGANIKYKAADFAKTPLFGRKWSKGCPPK
jgi:hypothetical protein